MTRRQWLAKLRTPGLAQHFGSFVDPTDPRCRCALGWAFDDDAARLDRDLGRYRIDNLALDAGLAHLGLTMGIIASIAVWNDDDRLSLPEIADRIEKELSPVLTKQGLFDNAWNGLKAQGWELSVGGYSCLYRGPEGRRCALGHSIPDDRYDPSLEGMGPQSEGVLAALGNPDVSLEFLMGLQFCHDNADSRTQLRANLLRFARDRNLRIPE